jgi:tRNA threonylcarbamoyladenosine biosynthesis protein TsaE
MSQFESRSEQETLEFGRKIGRSIEPPKIILLFGDLGVGKTVIARGICQGLGVLRGTVVHSPSFSLVNQYECAKGRIYHLDLYRLETVRDLYSIGIEDILSDHAVVIVEWAEKLAVETRSPLNVHIDRLTEPGFRTFRLDPPVVSDQE